MRHCDAIQEDLSAYLDGELSAQDRASVEEHLRGCAACRDELADLQGAISSVAALPKLKAPAGLAAQIRRQIETEKSAPRPVETPHPIDARPILRPTPSSWRPALMALAAMLMAAVLVFVVIPKVAPQDANQQTARKSDAPASTTERKSAPESKQDTPAAPKQGGFKTQQLAEGADGIDKKEAQKDGAFEGRAPAKSMPEERRRAPSDEVVAAKPPSQLQAPAPTLRKSAENTPSENKQSEAPRLREQGGRPDAFGATNAAPATAAPPRIAADADADRAPVAEKAPMDARNRVEGRGRTGEADPFGDAGEAEPSKRQPREELKATPKPLAAQPQRADKAPRPAEPMEREAKEKKEMRAEDIAIAPGAAATLPPPAPTPPSAQISPPAPPSPVVTAPVEKPAEIAAAKEDGKIGATGEKAKAVSAAPGSGGGGGGQGKGSVGGKAEADPVAAVFDDAIETREMVFHSRDPQQLSRRLREIAEAQGGRWEVASANLRQRRAVRGAERTLRDETKKMEEEGATAPDAKPAPETKKTAMAQNELTMERAQSEWVVVVREDRADSLIAMLQAASELPAKRALDREAGTRPNTGAAPELPGKAATDKPAAAKKADPGKPVAERRILIRIHALPLPLPANEANDFGK